MTVQQSYEPSSREESVEERHPEGAIRLLDGTILTCYPKPEEEMQQTEEVVADELPLETTGRHFGMGRRRIAPKPEAKEVLRQLFIDNAFYLLAHRERILQDSRMFLTPIGVQNGSSYTKSLGLDAPTIGVYLEWWSSCLGSMVLSKSGRMSLIYELTGSPHSKVTSGRQLYEDGETEPIHLYSFVHYWEPLIEINKRYNEAKKIYEAYTLQELLDILHEEDGGEKDFTSNVRERFLRHHIAELKAYIEHLYEEFSIRMKRWTHAELRLHDDEVRQIYADYKALEQRVTSEIEELRRQKQSMKRQLRSGQLAPRSYEEALKSVKAQTYQLKGQLSSFEYKVQWRFRDEGMISIQDICAYVQNKDKEASDTTNNY
ncbi:hypothetical protein [uncultured Porphyromonas sp.]|mgnify:CR=1 FL=1|uniref:hypothetical protein n=1 Tax=uncultured Porphyromonas sp. TaxID=159274 RepID=UPI0026334092|nr:hypothetical protein [uncultured Porphyromonas sp.]